MERFFVNKNFNLISNLACLFLLFTINSFIYSQEIEKDVRLLQKEHASFTELRSTDALTSNYDINYHRLELTVDPAIREINKGMVCTYFKPLSPGFNTIYFDFRSNMTVDSVVYNENLLAHTFNSSISLKIDFPSILPVGILDSIKIYYKGEPVYDGFGSFATGLTPCTQSNYRNVMWTLSEPFGSKTWWPCKETLDDKADSLDMIVTCPSPYRVGSNGLLISETTANGKVTYFWKHRYAIPAYLVAFAVADYSVYTDKVPVPGSPGDTINVLNYIYPCNLANAQGQTPLMTPMFQYFIEKFGPYPYEDEKYGHAQCGFGGGMEHSTMSFMGGFSKMLMGHELAHQWFGDKITCGTWNDIWLNEGFATYLEGLTCEQGLGDQTWINWKSGKINNVTSNNYGSTYVYDISSVSNIFNQRLVYNKGAMILHMLRWKFGDEDFFEGMLNYITDPELAYDYAVTSDFKEHMEAVSGTNLTEYLNDWLYGQGWPNYNVQWSVDNTCQKIYVTINQTHSAGLGTFFEMPVPIKFSNGSQNVTKVFHQNSPGDVSFVEQLDFVPTTATFDPDKWLCAKNTTTKVNFNNERLLVWTGAANDNIWHNSDNWDCGGVPDANDTVIVPENKTCMILPGILGECKKITVGNNSQVILRGDAILNVHK